MRGLVHGVGIVRRVLVFAAVVPLIAPPVHAQNSALPPAPAAALTIAPDHPLAWPVRLKLPDQREGDAGVILELTSDPKVQYLPRQRIDPGAQHGPEADLIAKAEGGQWQAEFEGPGAYTFVRAVVAGDPTPKQLRSAPAQVIEFVSGRDAGDGRAKVERTWFSYYEPTGEAPAKGLVLVMPGIFGEPRPVIERLIATLRARSWAVLRMNAQSSRFTENATFSIDTDHPADAARTIASELTQRVGECAFAVRAATAWCERAHPALRGLPRYAIGMSGGAMTLPSILAREPDRYTGAILIAGGAEWLSLTDLSVYKTLIRAVDFTWSRDPTPEDRTRASEMYLRACPLDSYHTATLLRGMRLLMVHGAFDLAVPAASGDLLWERLGRPTRWSLDAGHEQVFIWVNRSLPAIAGWLEGDDARPVDVK